MKYTPRNEYYRDRELLLAPIGRRFTAFLIDWIILILVYFGLIILFACFNMNLTTLNVHSMFDVEIVMTNTPAFVITILKIFLGLLPVLYFTLWFRGRRGQTPGKFLVRIRVISLYHERIGLWHSIERSLGYFASALEFGFGFIQAFWNANRMSLHDKIGETVVVRIPRANKNVEVNQNAGT
ncbi:MAG TPA: RDD family protein [Bacteroidales bacterium]|nr:RDD family protein [Bacteroidales bacterium]